MTVHSVVSLGHGRIGFRSKSCFCNECFANGIFHAKCSGMEQNGMEWCFTARRQLRLYCAVQFVMRWVKKMPINGFVNKPNES